MRPLLFLLASAALSFGAALSGNKITTNGTYTVTTIPGQAYVFAVSGTFGGGSLAINWNNGSSVAYTGSPATAAKSFTFTAAASTAELILTGSTSPDITVGINLAGGSGASVTTQDITNALGFSPLAGTVRVTYANNTVQHFTPAADTNAARGDALDAAWTSALATTGAETIDLTPGTYDCARATTTVISVATQFAMEAGMTLRLNGATVTHGTAFNGAVIFAADAVDDWSIIGPGIIQGTGTASTTPPSGANEIGINTRTARRFRISQVTCRFFKNTGFQFNSSSYIGHGTTINANLKISTAQVTDCHFDYNAIGFAIYTPSEYPKFTGCTFNNNSTGADIYGANCHFSNCEVAGNVAYGLRIRGHGGNDGHGSWVGGAINHNVGFAIHVEAAMTAAFMISGANIASDGNIYNKIESLGGGLTLSGCYVESPFFASATPAGMNAMIGCFIAGTYTEVTDLAVAEKAQWRFKENYTLTGAWSENN